MKVLVVSNTALRKDNANGFLLLTNLSAVDYKDRCSLYIQNAMPDKDSALSHFNITDKERLLSFFKKKDLGRVINNDDIPNEKTSIPSVGKHKGIKESDFFLFVREFIWEHGRWNRKKLNDYIYENKPTVIFYLCSRSIFMNNLVVDISKKWNIPVVIYTGEDEYFHTYPFYRMFKNILQRKLKKSYKELIDVTKSFICTQDKLAGQFHDEFNIETKVIMPSIELNDLKVRDNPNGHYVYVGNMQPNRVYTLIEISKALYKTKPNEIIDIYSGDITKSILKKINKLPNVVLHKPVPKEETINIIRSAKVILHFESFRKRDRVLIQNGFSTKIPDSLASGVPFVVVAPPYCGFSKYLSDNKDAVCYLNNLSLLNNELFFVDNKNMCFDAIQLAKENHDINKNAKKIETILLG